jgi:hypothetical protein
MNIFNCCLGSTRFSRHLRQQSEEGRVISRRQPDFAPLAQMPQMSPSYQQSHIDSPRPQVARQPIRLFDAPTLNFCFRIKPQDLADKKIKNRYRNAQIKHFNSRKVFAANSSYNQLNTTLTRDCQNVTKLVLFLGGYGVIRATNFAKLPIIELAHTLKQLKRLTQLIVVQDYLPISNPENSYVYVYAAIKSLRRLTKLALLPKDNGQMHFAAIVPGLARFQNLREFIIKYPAVWGGLLDGIALKLGTLQQITFLSLDFSNCNIRFTATQELASNFKQLTQLTHLVLKLKFDEHFVWTNPADRMDLRQWLNLLGVAIQQLPVLEVLKMDLNCTVTWREIEGLFMLLASLSRLEQIYLNLKYLESPERCEIEQKVANLFPNFKVEIQEKKVISITGYIYVLVISRG